MIGTAVPQNAPLRGDTCPSWCGGTHRDERGIIGGRPVHPDDAHREHQSCVVDSWKPADGWKPVTVMVRGRRHDNHDDDGTAEIVVSDLYGHRNLMLEPNVARRLAEAMLLACHLADGIALPEVLR